MNCALEPERLRRASSQRRRPDNTAERLHVLIVQQDAYPPKLKVDESGRSTFTTGC